MNFLLIGAICFISIVAATVIIVLISLNIKISKEKTSLEQKYSKIIDIEAEKDKIQKEIDGLHKEHSEHVKKIKQEMDTLHADYEKEHSEYIKKKEKYKSEFDNAESIIKKMKKEISVLEESLEIIDCGLYKPHFDFQDSNAYKIQLEQIYEKAKELIKNNNAVVCSIEWSVGGSKVEGRKMTKKNNTLMLRAFNGDCDAIISKVRWDNVNKMEERIKKSFEVINKTGEVNKSYITQEYLKVKLQELYATYEHQEKIKQKKEEQKRIQEEMREEEKARREIEKAKEEAEKEEVRYQKAIEKAKQELEKASEGKVTALNEKLQQLEEQLKEAQEKRERAISRAQLTKSGHVYVISNIGSFGENVFKIGMTRRLEPMDRVKELGDASVPFPFDVHAMIYSENAPELENSLHKRFADRSLNLVNLKKEFFSIAIDDIETWTKENNLNLQITKIAEARDYYETKAIRSKGNGKVSEIILEAEKEAEELTLAGVFSED